MHILLSYCNVNCFILCDILGRSKNCIVTPTTFFQDSLYCTFFHLWLFFSDVILSSFSLYYWFIFCAFHVLIFHSCSTSKLLCSQNFYLDLFSPYSVSVYDPLYFHLSFAYGWLFKLYLCTTLFRHFIQLSVGHFLISQRHLKLVCQRLHAFLFLIHLCYLVTYARNVRCISDPFPHFILFF